jgi:D-xylono/L-arabinono-1,4-lactonase
MNDTKSDRPPPAPTGPRTWRAEVVVPIPAMLGEGPLWDEAGRCLLWVDIEAGAIHRFVPGEGASQVAELGTPIGFVVPRVGGGYLAGTGEGIVALAPDFAREGLLAAPPDLAGRRMNDGTCDPAGRVIFGTVDPERRRSGSLWSLGSDGEPRCLADGVGMSNGIGFSPDGAWMYFVDTPTLRIDRFSYDPRTGEASDRRPFFGLPAGVGLPDGLAVDSRGAVWVAIWGAGEVWKVDAGGRHLGRVSAPVANTSSCAFGAAGTGRLFITTAAGEARAGFVAGSLLVAEVGADGVSIASAVI